MTRQTTLGSICQITGEACRHLSMEWASKLYTSLKKDPHTGMYEPQGMGSRKVLLGPRCNTAPIGKSGWISEMTSCPVLDGANVPLVMKPIKIPVGRGRKKK